MPIKCKSASFFLYRQTTPVIPIIFIRLAFRTTIIFVVEKSLKRNRSKSTVVPGKAQSRQQSTQVNKRFFF